MCRLVSDDENHQTLAIALGQAAFLLLSSVGGVFTTGSVECLSKENESGLVLP
jgi:hypothetical protein